LRNSPAALGVKLDNIDLLEGLKDFSVDRTGGIDVVGRAGSAVLLPPVGFAETTDADGFAEVDVTSDGCCADVEPVH
jgi:hypothetical protein